ncbi:biotin--[acetyl-CoA-carboxylase] ligase [Williamsia muralis]|uniref:biotin--[acetyl-CoA-carboxylase] ligase n=1 Tax=Williamsia marianensis TaxID=85044 RepID=UPI000DE7AFE9|nr:biotin--[acetyl-CoA-carboxylase] ligase [Williamsia marianensis]PVY31286.1 BirA family biotin operon repressor/biotin-[acetyl-CoA-carboxylase] ligase [Williamsia marianensis]
MTDERAPLDHEALRQAVTGTRWRSVRVVEETGSTNADLVSLAGSTDCAGSVLIAEHQTAGRGRHSRQWESPPRAQVALSVAAPANTSDQPQALGWLPLLTGLAVVEGIAETTDLSPRLKWPNDVLLFGDDTATDDGYGGRKVAGILAELTHGPSGPVVVIGLGINVSLTEAELPVPTAISLDLAGASVDRTQLAGAVLRALSRRLDQWPGDLGAVADDYRAACATLGHRVRVQMPAGEEIEGLATAIDSIGRVVVEVAPGQNVPVAAGDVTHLRVTD